MARKRDYAYSVWQIADSTATSSNALNFGPWGAGAVRVSYTTGACTFTVSDTETGTYRTLQTAAAANVTITPTGSVDMTLPTDLFGAMWVKIVATNNASGAQTAGVYLTS